MREPITYTVKSGDNLFALAQKYHTTPEGIIRLNRLSSMNLDVGQKLKIPVYTEAVVTGDHVNIHNVPGVKGIVMAQMDRGARLPVTGGDSEWLQVRLWNNRIGWISREFVTLVPHGGEKPLTEILGFFTEREGPTLPSSDADFRKNVAQMSDIAMFHFRIDREKSTEVEKFYEFTDDYMREVVQFGHRHNIRMLPIIHNLLYERGNQNVNKDVIRAMLATPQTRAAFINHVIEVVRRYGFDGAHIDFEDVHYEDRFKLSDFYREMGRAMHAQKLYFVVSTPSRSSDQPTNPFSAPFDYAVIGESADEFVAMLYNEHGWPGSGPGPVVSIGWMETVLRYARTKMPAHKVTAAVSVFGFDFNLTAKRNTYVTYGMAMDLAKKYDQDIIFDEKTQTPMFRYTDAKGDKHEVWFENAASIRAKVNLADRLGVRGLALWRLGMEDPGIWPMLAADFVVRKSVY
ncbi:LysM peptidoglycan-binding domain-containing protein [Tumebacillus sp. ITR2]|uniref:LysM peptidoglycan-binding domain-containing protein n=1 Tax=Tumebacillus amylolyticus TaxID=2801339 RepID=A0ABS1J805_9BACL|nr:glycosyl hydrolase family 18 protein [Tumebacillus amylolyticus]MBL0385783.1 LysM peptidoglycan-binding domain-containing protein [Tumebacillus amylolyticus]